jgi:hypothetical protein
MLKSSCLVAGFCVAMGVGAEPVALPGTTVTLEPPPGFEIAMSFAGFEDGSGSSIMVTELPREAYAQLSRAFATVEEAARNLAAQGVVVTNRSTLTANGVVVVVLVGSQQALGVTVGKYIALAQGEKTVLVTVNAVDGGPTADASLAAIASLSLGKEPSLEEKLANLTFSVELVSPFRIVDVLAGSSMMLTAGEDAPDGGARLMVVIASSLGRVEGGDPAALSERTLRETRGFADAMVVSAAPAPFAGGLGFRIEADSGALHVVQYLIVLPSGRSLRMVARGERAAIEPLAEALDALARSVRARETG